MTTPSSGPRAGWYPDPADAANIRYWDGATWTDRVQPKSVPPPPAAPAPSAAPTVPVPPPPAAPAPSAAPTVPVPPPAQPPSAPTVPVPPPAQAWPAAAPPAPNQPPPTAHPGYGAPPPAQPGYGPAPGYGYPPQPQLTDPYAYAPAPTAARPPGRIGLDGQILAGFWRRALGYILDSIIVGLPAAIVWLIVAVIVTSQGGTVFDNEALEEFGQKAEQGAAISPTEIFEVFGPGFWTAAAVSLGVWLLLSMFNGVYLIGRSGQTLGDRVISVRKVMAGRAIPSYGVALARWLFPNVLLALISYLIPFGSILTWLNYLWPAFDSRSQTWHDKICRTYVERSDLIGPPAPRR